jgi:hypothetical protein
MGCQRIYGELRKLGIRVSATTIRMLLRRHGLVRPRDAGDRRGRSSGGPKLKGSSVATSSRSRRSGSRPSMCCSSSS